MSTPSDKTPHGNAIEALQQELAAVGAVLVGLARELQADRVETAVRVEGLRAEQQRERRVRVMAIAGGGVGTVYAYDQHVEHCSPGARVVHGIDYLLSNPAPSGVDPAVREQQFQHVYDHASIWCDVTLPLHTHDGRPWPTGGDAIGIAALGLAVITTYAYHRFRTIRDYRRVAQAVEQEQNRGPS